MYSCGMMATVLLQLFLLSAVAAFTEQDCRPDGYEFREECFWVFEDVMRWVDADVSCRNSNNARLVTITDQEMNDFLAGIITRDVWVGLHDTHKEGDWRWADDTPVNYTNFNTDTESTQSDLNNCVMLKHTTGRWRDAVCKDFKGRICALPRGESICSNGGTFFRDRCYWYGGVNGWADANQDCRRFGDGVKLPVIHDAELNAFLSRMIYPGIWLGLQDKQTEGFFEWVDGSPLTENSYQKWRTGEPNPTRADDQDCVLLMYGNPSGNWNDLLCWDKQRYVCALQPCFDGGDGGSGGGEQGAATDVGHAQNCLNFGAERICTCVGGGLCKLDGSCRCTPQFDGMACDKDDMTVTIHAPNRLDRGSNVTMRCHVNLPYTDVTVLWKKVSGTEMFSEMRTRILERPEIGDYELVIENLQKEDTGSYACAATTILGHTSVVRMDSTYLHVVEEKTSSPNTEVTQEEPHIAEVSKGNDNNMKETGLIIAVTLLGIGFVCLLIAFIVVKVRLSSARNQSRRMSDMIM